MRRRTAEANQLALDRSRRAGQQCYLVLETYPLSPASPLIGEGCAISGAGSIAAAARLGAQAQSVSLSGGGMS
jgi:hypothetical protein